MASGDPALVTLGLLLCVFAAIGGSLGLLLMRLSSLVERDHPWYWRPRMVLGLALQGVLPIFTDSIAFVLVPLSLISPLAGVTIASATVLNAVNCLGVGEPTSARELACVGLIVVGVTLASSFGPRQSERDDMRQLGDYLQNPPFVAFATACGLTVVSWVGVLHAPCCRRCRPPKRSPTTAPA